MPDSVPVTLDLDPKTQALLRADAMDLFVRILHPADYLAEAGDDE